MKIDTIQITPALLALISEVDDFKGETGGQATFPFIFKKDFSPK
jgi:hypothetical protein